MEMTSAFRNVHLFEGDCNELAANITRAVPDRALALAFADPAGLDIDLETLRTLASRGSV
jgi:hypothetical protein